MFGLFEEIADAVSDAITATAEASEEAHMPKPIITLPCTARELEDALHRVCDHVGPWDGNVRVVLDKTRNGYNLEIETKGETK